MQSLYTFLSVRFSPHDRLLNRIIESEVDPRVATWIWQFLRGRTQRVRIDDFVFDEAYVTSGVPQQSVLRPLPLTALRLRRNFLGEKVM